MWMEQLEEDVWYPLRQKYTIEGERQDPHVGNPTSDAIWYGNGTPEYP